MQTASERQKYKNNDPEWYLITEFSLSEAFIYEETAAELRTESLVQTMRASGLPPDCLKRVERTITKTAREAANNFHLGGQNAPVDIHLFCHKRIVDRLGHSEEQMIGGWGCYGIERGNTSNEESHRVIEIYIYKEGE